MRNKLNTIYIRLTPGIGIKYFEKNFNINMTEAQYEAALWQAYLKAWKNDEKLADENLRLAKQLLMLKNIE